MKEQNRFYLLMTYYNRYNTLKNLLNSDLDENNQWSAETFEKIRELSEYDDLRDLLYDYFNNNMNVNGGQYLSLSAVRKSIISEIEDEKKSPYYKDSQLQQFLWVSHDASVYILHKKENSLNFAINMTIDELLKYPDIFAKAIKSNYLNKLANAFLTYHFSITHRDYNPQLHDIDCDYKKHDKDYHIVHSADTKRETYVKAYFKMDLLKYPTRIKFLKDFLEAALTADEPIPEIHQKILDELKIKSSSLPLILSELRLNSQQRLWVSLRELDPSFNIDWKKINPYKDIVTFQEYYYLFTVLLHGGDSNYTINTELAATLAIKGCKALRMVLDGNIRSCNYKTFEILLTNLLAFDSVVTALSINKELLNHVIAKACEYYLLLPHSAILLAKLLENPKLEASITQILIENMKMYSHIIDISHSISLLSKIHCNVSIDTHNAQIYVAQWLLRFELTYSTNNTAISLPVVCNPRLGIFLSTLQNKTLDNLLVRLETPEINYGLNFPHTFGIERLAEYSEKPETFHKILSYDMIFNLTMNWYDLTPHMPEFTDNFAKIKVHLEWLQNHKELAYALCADYLNKLNKLPIDNKIRLEIYTNYKEKFNGKEGQVRLRLVNELYENWIVTRYESYVSILEEALLKDDYDEASDEQFWTISGRIKHIDHLLKKWSDQTPVRTTNPKLKM